MKEVMRKTILFAAVLLSVFSCKVDDGNYNIVDSLKLSEYGSNVVISYIEPCASMMFFLLELDTFEAMTSEEQKESWLNGFVLHLDENTLSMETGYYEATFHTGGKSIRDAGTEWKVDNYCGYYYYNNYAFDVVVRCAGDGVWRITSEVPATDADVRMEITAEESPDGFTGTFTVSGSETSSDGYKALFSNSDSPCVFTYSRPDEEGLTGPDFNMSGVISVDIYDGQGLKDWCVVDYSSDGQTSFRTSRD